MNYDLGTYQGPWTQKQIVHLLRRTTFGAKLADIDHFKKRGLTLSLIELLQKQPTPSPSVIMKNNPDIQTELPIGSIWVDNIPKEYNYYRFLFVHVWWIEQIINQNRNITEKMVLFLENLTPINWEVTPDARFVYNNNKLRRDYALGNYKEYLKKMTIDPAMLYYLNNIVNEKNSPDENYARELQELFTLGKGSDSKYTEDDVIAAAKVLTGWRVNWDSATGYFEPYYHHTGDKQFSPFFKDKLIMGKSGAEGASELDELINMIFEQNEVAKFICRKLYIFFVHYNISPEVEENIITPLATIFRNSNYNFKPVLQKLFSSKHFYDDELIGSMIKSPVDMILGTARTLNFIYGYTVVNKDYNVSGTEIEQKYWNFRSLWDHCSYMGQALTGPPNVAGWPAYRQSPQYYQAWINADTLSWRAYTMRASSRPPGGYYHYPNLSFNWPKLISGLSDPSNPNKVVQELVNLLLTADLTIEDKNKLKVNYLLRGSTNDGVWTALWLNYTANPSNTTNYNAIRDRIVNLLESILMSPEYQLM